MKTVSTKLLSLLLVALLLVSAIPFQAFAESTSHEYCDTLNTGVCEHCGRPEADHPAGLPNEGEDEGIVHNENIAGHVSGQWFFDSASHWKQCQIQGCEMYGAKLHENKHILNATTGKCMTCDYVCPHSEEPILVNASEATCGKNGYTGDEICPTCGFVLKKGATIMKKAGSSDPADHNVPEGSIYCLDCGKQFKGEALTLTLIAQGASGEYPNATVRGGTSINVTVYQSSPISELPGAVMQGYEFLGWFLEDGTQLRQSSNYPLSASATAYARFKENTYRLTVRRVLNGDFSTALTVYDQNIAAGTPLLSYLQNNVFAAVETNLASLPGYHWEYNFWYDYSGKNNEIRQGDCMNQHQTVYVNFVTDAYTLYFDANGGTVTPASKAVRFNAAVGTLPTPYLAGKVFQGWQDEHGNIYTSNTVYKVAGDTSLTAVWQDEALVLLYVYVNGDFSGCNRIIVMDGFVKNNNVSRSDVLAQVGKYYAPTSGSLNIAGLFDEYTWSSYRVNTSKPGTENIQITGEHTNKIYVMVNNAKSGTTVVTNNSTTNNGTTTNNNGITGTTAENILGAYWVSTGNGTGYWVYPAPNNSNNGSTNPTVYYYYGTNPKTGDSSMIEVAAAVMVLAAAAVVTIITLRKKKMI